MYIGIDLGGTNIAVGVVDDNGKILCKDSTPTISTRPYQEIVRDMAMLSKKVVADAGLTMGDIKAIGIGSPGSVDNKNGKIAFSNNIPFRDTPLAEELRKYIDLPINIENDANAAAYGEYIATKSNSDSFVFITLGTGVGGGVIIDGKIFRGFNGAGGELGHTIMCMDGEPCTCGNKGCWETYASVTALIRQTEKAMQENPNSLMHEKAQEEGKVSGRTAFLAAADDDEAAKKVVDTYIRYIAVGLSSVINIFQPEILVIGGGISKEGDTLLLPLKKYVDNMDYNKYLPKTTIKIATLFNDAGIIGAALAANNE